MLGNALAALFDHEIAEVREGLLTREVHITSIHGVRFRPSPAAYKDGDQEIAVKLAGCRDTQAGAGLVMLIGSANRGAPG